MRPVDPLTFFVASSVMPAAVASCLFWSFYLMAGGAGDGAVPAPTRARTPRPSAADDLPIPRAVAKG